MKDLAITFIFCFLFGILLAACGVRAPSWQFFTLHGVFIVCFIVMQAIWRAK